MITVSNYGWWDRCFAASLRCAPLTPSFRHDARLLPRPHATSAARWRTASSSGLKRRCTRWRGAVKGWTSLPCTEQEHALFFRCRGPSPARSTACPRSGPGLVSTLNPAVSFPFSSRVGWVTGRSMERSAMPGLPCGTLAGLLFRLQSPPCVVQTPVGAASPMPRRLRRVPRTRRAGGLDARSRADGRGRSDTVRRARPAQTRRPCTCSVTVALAPPACKRRAKPGARQALRSPGEPVHALHCPVNGARLPLCRP